MRNIQETVRTAGERTGRRVDSAATPRYLDGVRAVEDPDVAVTEDVVARLGDSHVAAREVEQRALGVGARTQQRVRVARARVREESVETVSGNREGERERREHDREQPCADAAQWPPAAHSIM